MEKKQKRTYDFLDFKKLLYLFLIIILIAFVSIYFKNKYKYLVGNDLLNNTQVILDGDITVDDQPEYTIKSNNLIGPLRNEEVYVEKINNLDHVYNVFQFTGFNPGQEYNVNLEFYVRGLEESTPLVIGTKDTRGQNYVADDNEKVLLNNIELEDSINFSKGYSDYISIPISFTANDDGAIFIVFGIEVGDKKVLDYKFSNVRIVL